jgi:hypothetical protein
MEIRRVIELTALAGWIALTLGCAVSKPVPDGFASVIGGHEFKALTPDGVVLSVHEVDNDPKADLNFWSEALKTRMSQAGYRVLGDSVLSGKGSEVSLLRLAAPLGQKDYLYYVALSMHGAKIRVTEAAGETSRFQARAAAVLQAMIATDP